MDKKIVITLVVVIIVLISVIAVFVTKNNGNLFKACNVQNIKLHGQLFTYRNGASDDSGQISKDIASSEEIVQVINKAEADNSIKAIILEVDSTGGSGVAGEEIAQALKRSKKPTVALIRDSGDSASYLASTGAGYIIASDDSGIGGIGTTSSYVGDYDKNTQDGLTFYQLSIGKFKDTGNPDKQLTPEDQQLIMRNVNIEYNNFIKTVSENRHLDASKVKSLADGSVMLGQMAKDNGLIDKVGGIYDAEDYLKQKIKTNVSVCW